MLLAHGIPAAPINDLPTMLNDPHVLARGLVGDGYINPPVQFSATPAQVCLPPPRLGQHSAEILREVLNMDADQVAGYTRRGIIAL